MATRQRRSMRSTPNSRSVKPEPGEQLTSPPATPVPSSQRASRISKRNGKTPVIKTEENEGLLTPVSSERSPRKILSSKRKRTVKQEDEDEYEEPSSPESKPEDEFNPSDDENDIEWERPKKPAKKVKRTTKEPESGPSPAKDIKSADSTVGQLARVKARHTEEAKRREKALETGQKSKGDTYGLSEGETPFPRWEHPTPAECEEVYKILLKKHPDIHPQPKTIPEPSKFVAGCGEVRSILDALIRTRLSASTTNRNSNAAYQGMVKRYGLLKSGVGKGSVDYNAVRKAPVQDLFYAIKNGGLAVSKSADIKAILDLVYEENQARRTELLEEKSSTKSKKKGPKGADVENEAQKAMEIKLAEDENLSLDHYYTLPTYDAIYKFMTYPGIGVKTAACVAMFCMQRPCFAVDTHVFRIAKWLGWVPPPEEKQKGDKTVDRDTTFSHLEVRVPDKYKYELHQLFIKHGKTCPRCRGNTGPGSAGWADGCVIDHLVRRSGPRKE